MIKKTFLWRLIVKNIAFALVALIAVASTVPAVAKEAADQAPADQQAEATVEQVSKSAETETPADATTATADEQNKDKPAAE